MEKLITHTTAYKIFSGDVNGDRLSHAYMLAFPDGENLAYALKLFAAKLFNFNCGSREEKLVKEGKFSDLKIYPKQEKKLSVDDASEIIQDCALGPIECDKKVYIISDFDTASALFQNKLLKVLEEPPRNVYFILGARTLTAVLDTVKSRVNKLEITPFSPEQIECALERTFGVGNYKNVARCCGGSFGEAAKMLSEGWFAEILEAAKSICQAYDREEVALCAIKYGDEVRKRELLAQIQRVYYDALTGVTKLKWSNATLIYAVEAVVNALTDVKFNCNFASLLYEFMLSVIRFEERHGDN